MLQDLVNTVLALGFAAIFAAVFFGFLWIPALITQLSRRGYVAARHDHAHAARTVGPVRRLKLPFHRRSADPLS
jgi:hypothetical protein